MTLPLSIHEIARAAPDLRVPLPGRQMRVFARLVKRDYSAAGATPSYSVVYRNPDAPEAIRTPFVLTYGVLFDAVRDSTDLASWRDYLSRIKFRTFDRKVETMEQLQDASKTAYSDPSIHEALQDLAFDFNIDLRDALAGLDDPNAWYPGVDEGIELVTDEHVELVMAALQRELNRETRDRNGKIAEPRLPPAPLDRLPWRIKRALVERRRLRFAEFGIGRREWETDSWSLWDVPPDPDWLPRRLA